MQMLLIRVKEEGGGRANAKENLNFLSSFESHGGGGGCLPQKLPFCSTRLTRCHTKGLPQKKWKDFGDFKIKLSILCLLTLFRPK